MAQRQTIHQTLRHLGLTLVCCAMMFISSGPLNGQTGFRESKLTADTDPNSRERLALQDQRSGVFTERPEYQFASPNSLRQNGQAQSLPLQVSPLSGSVYEIINGQSAQPGFEALAQPLRNTGSPFIPATDNSQSNSNSQRYDAGSLGQEALRALQRDGRIENTYGDNLEAMPPPLIEVDKNASTPDGMEVITQRYPDGKPRIVRHVAQDEQGNYYNHGPWQVLTPSGRVVADGMYQQGLMHGQWRREHAADSGGLFETSPFDLFQGPFLSVASFREGKLDGVWTIYDQRRTKIFEITYQKGVRNGDATWFFPNNAKMRVASFKDGLIDGEIVEFDESEKPVKRQQYVDGRRIVRNTTFYRPDVLKTEEYFLSSQLKPEDEDNWWEAKPTPFLSTGSETQNGSAKAWYENGQPKKQGQFKSGEPVGQFTSWHENGNKQIEGFYEKGLKSRRWTWWYENGFKQFEGVFDEDAPVGVWRAWYDDGQLRTEKDYSEVNPKETELENIESEPFEEIGNSESENGKEEPSVNELIVTEPLPTPQNEPIDNESGEEPDADPSIQPPLEEIAPGGFREPNIPGAASGEEATENGELELIAGELIAPTEAAGQVESNETLDSTPTPKSIEAPGSAETPSSSETPDIDEGEVGTIPELIFEDDDSGK